MDGQEKRPFHHGRTDGHLVLCVRDAPVRVGVHVAPHLSQAGKSEWAERETGSRAAGMTRPVGKARRPPPGQSSIHDNGKRVAGLAALQYYNAAVPATLKAEENW